MREKVEKIGGLLGVLEKATGVPNRPYRRRLNIHCRLRKNRYLDD